MEFIGEGSFGKVVKCRNIATQEIVAIKIMNNDHLDNFDVEVSMLEMIRSLGPVCTNIVHFMETFDSLGFTCLTFEMLDLSLSDLMERREWEPLVVSEIRPVAQQMFVALDALLQLGILHTDIKPDNIMLVDLQKEGMRIKLIDFGRAIAASSVYRGLWIQPLGYRAPEVTLGLPYGEPIDVWGLGCVLAFLYLAEHLFPNDRYQMMKCMVELLGQPDDHMLQTGRYSECFFCEVQAGESTSWRLKTHEEFAAANDIKPMRLTHNLPSSVEGLFDMYEETECAESEDRRAFLDLLKMMLHVDGTQRITPHQALQHPFITMSILTEDPEYSAYLTSCRAQMRVCPSNPGSGEPALNAPDEVTTPTYDKDSWFSSNEAEAAYHREEVSWVSSEGAEGVYPRQEVPNSTGEASSTSVRKRVHMFFRQAVAHVTCCKRPNVED